MTDLMIFAASLMRKLRAASHDARAVVRASIKDAQDSGLIPLGMRTDDGGPAYVWLLFDRSRLTLTERMDYVRANTPPGVRVRTLEI